jgi:hypothetical protein
MDFNNSLYYVLPSDMVQQLNLENLQEVSYEQVRKSVDGSLCIIEYKGTMPVTTGSFLTHEQALELMNTPEWTGDDLLP